MFFMNIDNPQQINENENQQIVEQIPGLGSRDSLNNQFQKYREIMEKEKEKIRAEFAANK